MRNPTLSRFFKLCLLFLPLLFATIYVQQSDASSVFAPHTHLPVAEVVQCGNEIISVPTAQAAQKGYWSQCINLYGVGSDAANGVVLVHMIMLKDGQILGWDRENTLTDSMQLYNLNRQSYARSLNPPDSVFCAGHILLPNGNLLLAGGHDIHDYDGIPRTYLYDPFYGTWTRAGDLNQARWYPTITPLSDGRLVLMGGTINGNEVAGTHQPGDYATLPEIFSPATNTWTPLSSPSALRDVGLYPRNFLMPAGHRIFVADERGNSAILDVNTQSWTPLANNGLGGSGPSAVMYRPGKVLYTIGQQASIIDLNNPVWIPVQSMKHARYDHTLVVLPNGNVLAVGGSRSTIVYTDQNAAPYMEMWNPTKNVWEEMLPMREPRMYHSTAFLLPDATVFVAGGGRGVKSIFQLTDYPTGRIYYPPYLFKGARPIINGLSSTNITRGGNMIIGTSNAASIGSVVLMGLPSTTHGISNTQSYVPLTIVSRNAGSLNVRIPSEANTLPPGSYMLFIINNNGVPSVARFVSMASYSRQ